MGGIKIKYSHMNDRLLLAITTAIILAWSLLTQNAHASFAAIGVALWFPASVIGYTAMLRWLPVIGGLHSQPIESTPLQRRRILALCLLIASFSITLLIFTPAPHAIMQIFALNFVCLLALFDRKEHWLPSYILYPTFLVALVFGIFLDTTQSVILGAAIAWVVSASALVCLSITLRRNLVSGDYMALAGACGASVGLGSVWTFLTITAFALWAAAIFRRYRRMPYAASTVGMTCALTMALTFLMQHLPNLTNVFPELSHQISQKLSSSSAEEH